MPKKKHKVTLREDEKKLLYEIMNKGSHSVQKRGRAQTPLFTEGYTDKAAAGRTGTRLVSQQRPCCGYPTKPPATYGGRCSYLFYN